MFSSLVQISSLGGEACIGPCGGTRRRRFEGLWSFFCFFFPEIYEWQYSEQLELTSCVGLFNVESES